MTRVQLAIGLVLAGLGFGGCAYDVGEGPPEAGLVAQREQAVIGGTEIPYNSNAVAIYHKNTGECVPYVGANFFPNNDTNPNIYNFSNMWWPRPCSGRVIKKDGTTNYILTARHCVTKNGEIDDPNLVSAGGLVSTSRVDPGVLDVDEQAKRVDTIGTPVGVTSTVYYQNYATYGDLAIVKAVGDLQPTDPPTRRGILAYTNDAAPSLADNGNILRTEGYGSKTSGSCYGFENSGAGILRHDGGWDVTAVYLAANQCYQGSAGTCFAHTLTANGATVAGGDSGGSLYFLNIAQNWTAIRDVGVNSGSSIGAGGPVLLDFIQTALGYVFLVSVNKSSSTLVVGAAGGDGSLVTQNFTASNVYTRITFDRVSGLLQLNGLCIRDQGLGTKRQDPFLPEYESRLEHVG